MERLVNIDLQEAYLFADLTGIRDDLEATAAIGDLMLKEKIETKEDEKDFTMSQALLAAALVSYARAFKSGVRAKELRDKITSMLPEELHEKHQWAIDMRDKFVAHSVNAFEDNQVVASLFREEHGHNGIFRITVRRSRLAALGDNNIMDLKKLCKTLIDQIDTLIEEENKKVLEAAKQIPIDQLYALQPVTTPLPDRSEVGKRRKRK
jgi:hypothetical protein